MRLRVEVVKKCRTSSSAQDGEFDTSITVCAPLSASATPSPLSVSTPDRGEAETASWPNSRSWATTCEPISPLPPMTTNFMIRPFQLSADDLVQHRTSHQIVEPFP